MKTKANANIRTRLIQAAVKLTYQDGFGKTTLANIAKEAQVPVGNIFYYFKTRGEVGDAIVSQRFIEMRALMSELDKVKSPKERLCGFVQMTFDNREGLTKRGCQIGTFCSELGKDGGPLSKKASLLFADLLVWLASQFTAMQASGDPRGLSVHLLSALQGVAVLANSIRDPDLVEMETQRLTDWVRSL